MQAPPSHGQPPIHAKAPGPAPSPIPLRRCRVHNRLEAAMVHVNWYLFSPQARLARDAGVSRSALCRVLSGQSVPTFALMWKVAKALERRLWPEGSGRTLDPAELFSLDGTYPTPSTCDLVGCPGCRLAQAMEEEKAHRRPKTPRRDGGA